MIGRCHAKAESNGPACALALWLRADREIERGEDRAVVRLESRSEGSQAVNVSFRPFSSQQTQGGRGAAWG